MQFGVVHYEAAFIVIFPAARYIVVKCAAGCDYDVDEFALNQFFDHASGARGADVSWEREEFNAVFAVNHVFHYGNACCELSGGETPCGIHLQNQVLHRHFFCKLVIFYGYSTWLKYFLGHISELRCKSKETSG